ncbi:MAG: DUF1428 domain-containing protein [Rhizobiales bacterium]|nr:DUF1428 domain-containing protein [Hyphomicrobiales bacterium]
MSYVDGFVAAVPNANKQAFIEHATLAAEIFKDHGALKVVENWGDEVPDGKLTSFPMAVKKQEDETVVFSWIVWASKEAHEAGWAKIMEDERMSPENMTMPFDGKRILFGKFETVLEA